MIHQILNVNLDLVESRLPNAIKESKVIRHNNYLMSNQEINSVISIIKQRLEVEGKIDLEEIALSNEFNMAFTKKIIE